MLGVIQEQQQGQCNWERLSIIRILTLILREMGSHWMVFEPGSDMICFMMSYFYSGCCVGNRLKKDKGRGRETS